MSTQSSVVNSYNEWDPLEEVVVGVLDGAVDVDWEIALEAVTPVENMEAARKSHMKYGGKRISKEEQVVAQKELDEFVHILEQEGVNVRRPTPLDHAAPFGGPGWSSKGGNCQANPRDTLIVFGDEIIEATMSWRSRYFEVFAYRELLKEYFKAGARWTAAPRPQLTSESYDYHWERGKTYVTTNEEILFDAADIARCGKDVFVQRSHTTNDFAIEWLQRHLGNDYRVHRCEFDDYRSTHIDATFVPLAPGKMMVNPDRPLKEIPAVLKNSGWDFLEAPYSSLPKSDSWYAWRWLSMNVLSLDEERVICEAHEEPMIKALKDWGFKPIPVSFRNNYFYGGSFHCATLDVRRKGGLQSYFNPVQEF